MNPILCEIIDTGMTMLPNGSKIKAHSGVGPESGRVLRHAIEVSRPAVGIEVGLAFGLSTLHILDAMQEHGNGRLIGMDPAQDDSTWQDGGLHNVQRAGFSECYEFHRKTSQQLLPQLAVNGLRIQFGFLDGWHTFDHTLVDFFYIDSMLDVGGVIVLDDVGYPGLQRLAHFIVCNRSYSILDLDPRPLPSGWRVTAKSLAKKALEPLVRDNLTPSSVSAQLRAQVDRAALIALQKVGEDKRRFDHFEPF